MNFLRDIFLIILAWIGGFLSLYLRDRIKDKGWKNENILRPLYNEVSQIMENEGRDLKISHTSTTWDNIDSYSRAKIPQKLQKILNTLSAEIHKWNKLASSGAKLTKNASISLAKKLENVFPERLMLREGDRTWLLLEEKKEGPRTEIVQSS